MILDRRTCVNELATALSRYDGHTTFARLERILALPLSNEFNASGSVYASQLIHSTIGTEVAEVAARRHVDHAVALGLLDRVSTPGEVVRVTDAIRKVDVTSRVALTPLARALRAADSLDHKSFREFLLACTLLHYDFDIYGLVLRLALSPPLRIRPFIDAFRHTASARGRWIEGLQPVLRSQLSGLVPWLVSEIGDRSLTHHFNLRRSWAISAGHLCPDTYSLTRTGHRYATRIREAGTLFWLAPRSDCIEKLRLSPLSSDSGPSSSWALMAPSTDGSAPAVDVVDAVAQFMIDAFQHLRMHLFRQAPITAVIPFVHYSKHVLADRASTFDILQSAVGHRRIDCMLSRNVESSYYQVRLSTPT